MPLGVGVSQPGSEAGGHRLISVCSFYKPRLAQMGCRENEDFEVFFFFLTQSLASLHSFSLFCCFFFLSFCFLYSQPQCFSQGQVWSLSCLAPLSTSRLFSPHLPLLALFLPICITPLHHLSIFRFSLGLFFTFPLSHISYFFPLNVSLLSLSRLLLTLFIAHTVSPLRSSSSSPLLSPLSLCTPSFILYSWHHVLFSHFHPHFPYTSLLHSHLPSLWHSQAVCGILSSVHPPCTLPLLLPSRFISLFTEEWWEIWKCQRDQAGDQRGLC